RKTRWRARTQIRAYRSALASSKAAIEAERLCGSPSFRQDYRRQQKIERADRRFLVPGLDGFLSRRDRTHFTQCFDRNSMTAALNAAGSRTGPSWLTFGRTTCSAPGAHLLMASLIITK